MDKFKTITDRINRKPKSTYNILSFPTHEGYQTLLSKTGHNFILLDRGGESKSWDSRYRKVPENCSIVNNCYDDFELDFVLSNERFGQLQFALELSMHYRLPIIHLEHVEPQKDRWDDSQFESMKSIYGHFNVFITEHNKKSWESQDGIVVPHGIDSETFNGWSYPKNKKKYVLYVVNQLEGRDYFCGYSEWVQIKERVQSVRPDVEFVLVGDNPGISTTISDEQELNSVFANSLCYLNTTRLSPVPMSLLEAMSCGCPVITTANQEVPRIINGKNGIASNDVDILVESIVKAYDNQKWAESLGANARKTIKEDFSLNSFVNNWNNIFDQAYNMNVGKYL
jgi:glycosyltransferase involved in cell wall biosynthesis